MPASIHPSSAGSRVGDIVLLKSSTPAFLSAERFVSLHSQRDPTRKLFNLFPPWQLQLSHSSAARQWCHLSFDLPLLFSPSSKTPFEMLSPKVFFFYLSRTAACDQDKCGKGWRRLPIGRTLDILLHHRNTVKSEYLSTKTVGSTQQHFALGLPETTGTRQSRTRLGCEFFSW